MSKKLTQAVFERLPSEYRWAAVDSNGECYAFGHKPLLIDDDQWVRQKNQSLVAKFVGKDYEAADWQNSLIERKYDIASILNPEEQDNELLAAIDQQTTEIEALQAIIDNQAVEIEALKESQSDLRGFLHEQIEKNFELLNRQKWISVADKWPPNDGEPFVVLDSQNSMFVAYWFSSTIRTFDTRRQRLAPEFLVGWTKLLVPDYEKLLPQPPEGV